MPKFKMQYPDGEDKPGVKVEIDRTGPPLTSKQQADAGNAELVVFEVAATAEYFADKKLLKKPTLKQFQKVEGFKSTAKIILDDAWNQYQVSTSTKGEE